MDLDFTDNFARGIEQFNQRQFFESHETWEEIWLAAFEPDKTFLQGIIQVAAGFHHSARGNRAGAESLVRAGLKKLERFSADYHGLQLDAFRVAVGEWLTALANESLREDSPFPKIRRREEP
jgi:predicted metal-dependent hydrolase